MAYVGGARNEHYRVGWLEYGTAQGDIRPDDQEAITTPEGRAPVPASRHPAHQMLARAAHDLDMYGDDLLAPELSAWA